MMPGPSSARHLRTFWLLSVLMCPWQLQAAETTYYNETPWELTLVTDDSGAQNPYCALRTSVWEKQSVSIEFTLTALDTVEEFVRLRKNGWGLPEGATTKVTLASTMFPEGAPVEFKATSSEDLYARLLSQTEDGKFGLVLLFGLGMKGLTPIQAIFRFQGNEPQWIVPAASPSDYPALTLARENCLIDLRKLGHQRFNSKEATSTSPFADPNGAQTGKSKPVESDSNAEGGSMPNESEDNASGLEAPNRRWSFTQHEQDWGTICVIETRKDNVNIGFAIAPGENLLAFIDGLDLKSAKSIWRVDSLRAHAVVGKFDDYYKGLGFTFPTARLIAELAEGSVLNLSVIGKARYAIEVSPAREAFTQFAACYEKNGVADEDIVE